MLSSSSMKKGFIYLSAVQPLRSFTPRFKGHSNTWYRPLFTFIIIPFHNDRATSYCIMIFHTFSRYVMFSVNCEVCLKQSSITRRYIVTAVFYQYRNFCNKIAVIERYYSVIFVTLTDYTRNNLLKLIGIFRRDLDCTVYDKTRNFSNRLSDRPS